VHSAAAICLLLRLACLLLLLLLQLLEVLIHLLKQLIRLRLLQQHLEVSSSKAGQQPHLIPTLI
jgi:hypothetical protein